MDQKSKNYANKLKMRKACKKLKMGLNSYYTTKVDSKAFAIPNLTAIVSIIIKANAVRMQVNSQYHWNLISYTIV